MIGTSIMKELKRDVGDSYTLKSNNNNCCQHYNVVPCFSSFCGTELKKETRNGRNLPVKHKH